MKNAITLFLSIALLINLCAVAFLFIFDSEYRGLYQGEELKLVVGDYNARLSDNIGQVFNEDMKNDIAIDIAQRLGSHDDQVDDLLRVIVYGKYLLSGLLVLQVFSLLLVFVNSKKA